MKKIILGLSIAASLLVTSTVMAAGSSDMVDMPEVAKKYNCNSCHAIDLRVVGPAWKAVAEKYRGDATAPGYLLTKISMGGRGVWGTMPMPGNDPKKTKQADMKELVKFILAL